MPFIQDLKEIEQIVTDWAYNLVTETVDALTKDAQPFALDPQTKEEKLREYLAIKGNPEKWASWLQSTTETLVKKLGESGLDERQIATTHPYDTVIRIAMKYSYDMEGELRGHVPTGS